MARTIRRRRQYSAVPSLVAFFLVASFGILFAGCGGVPPEPPEEFTFTAEDIARFRELAEEQTATGSRLTGTGGTLQRGTGAALSSAKIDLSLLETYRSIRTGADTGKDVYRVTNEFLNVRSSPSVTAEQIERLNRGDAVQVVDFLDASWAKVKLPSGREGFVAQRYIAKLVAEDRLAEEKVKYQGVYFVNFGFVNVRKEADSESEKLGEIPGQSFVRPLAVDAQWARVPFEGKEGYVSMQYLTPFVPNFLVRQDAFTLPILHYRLVDDASVEALGSVVARLKQEGVAIITLKDFRALLLSQEERDQRVNPSTVVLAVSDITPDNVGKLSQTLRSAGVRATLFLQTKHLGLKGITEKDVVTLLANGFDLQSGGHTGDDLRSLTNSQVELEVRQSRQLLEEMTRQPVFAIGYPEGGVNDRVAKFAAEAGYLLGIATSPERTFRREQLLKLPSFVLTANETPEEVLKIAKGE